MLRRPASLYAGKPLNLSFAACSFSFITIVFLPPEYDTIVRENRFKSKEKQPKTMAGKQDIVSRLGEERLLLPELAAQGLRANDRVKYYFALLQTARLNCDDPALTAPDLKGERIACGITDPAFDTVIADTARPAPGTYAIPLARTIFAAIHQDIKAMLAPLSGASRKQLDDRLERQAPALEADDAVSGATIDAMTSGNRKKRDSLHLIVMDAHKALNRLQADLAVEQVDGAHAYNLSPHGRDLTAAFMKGLNRTAPLKFEHPGLGTTATEYDDKLVIQNDIGATDAHVLVIRVSGMTVDFTYTDIHLQRLNFFQGLFNATKTVWEKTGRKKDPAFETSGYYLSTALFEAADTAELKEYLEFLGSRLVFLIDWNKARKRLRKFIGKKDAVRLLQWAADNDYGHRGLLEIGGEEALFEAVEFAAGSRLHYGDRLDKMLGNARTEEFLRFALCVASTQLRQKRSGRVIRDELKTRLSGYFESAYIGLLVLAGRHAEYIFELAAGLRDAVYSAGNSESRNLFEQLAQKAGQWESRADQVFNMARSDARRIRDTSKLLRFFERADDAADLLEDAVSILPLVSRAAPGSAHIERVREPADQLVESVQEFIRCIEHGISAARTDIQADMDDFLNSADRMIQLEHQSDDLFRTVREHLVLSSDNHRELFLLMELARMIESAINSLAHGSQVLRNYIMELSLG